MSDLTLTPIRSPVGRPDYPELRLDDQLCLALQVADSLVTRLYRERLKALDLSPPQYLVLLALWERGRCTMGDLRCALHMDTGALTPLVKRMESGGLLRRTRDTVDERRVWVDLTERGWALRDRAAAARREVKSRIPLSPDALAALRQALQQLNGELLAVEAAEHA